MPNFDLLPDNVTFAFWEDKTVYQKTYYVSQQAANASDTNPGTRELPFKTISRAAEVLQPAEKVVIGSGVYEEFVRPVNGGTGPDGMICYEAAPGANVILSGARVWQADFERSEGWGLREFSFRPAEQSEENIVIWHGKLPFDQFIESNPFSMTNLPAQRFSGCGFLFHKMPKESDYKPFIRRRGMLFSDGQPLVQVNHYYELASTPGSFWPEDNGIDIHFRLPDDGNPDGHTLTFTCCEQLFSPKAPYLAYIRVKGLTFEYVGNGFPGSQRGALSTHCGHHWIIEDNTIRWCNSVGMDMGHENPMRSSNHPSGGHIVRNNHVTDCGICGICGVPSKNGMQDLLVENNLVENCCWQDAEFLYECAGIKIHVMHNSLIRNNIVNNTKYGTGIWADFANRNTRITANVVMNTKHTIFGAIFVEGSQVVNLVDHNVVWKVGANPLGDLPQRTGTGGHGLYEHDCDNLHLYHNLVIGAEGSGAFLNYGDPIRVVGGRGPMGMKHRVIGNMIADCGFAIVLPNDKNFTDENVFGTLRHVGPFRIRRIQTDYEWVNLEAWQEFHEWELNGLQCAIEAEVDEEKLELVITVTNNDKRIAERIDLRDKERLAAFIENLAARLKD